MQELIEKEIYLGHEIHLYKEHDEELDTDFTFYVDIFNSNGELIQYYCDFREPHEALASAYAFIQGVKHSSAVQCSNHEDLDKTPFQCDCFTRGEDYSYKAAIRKIKHFLSGNDDGSGSYYAELEEIRRDILELIKLKKEGQS